MKTILLSIVSTVILTLSYLSIEPLSSVYVQVKTIEILNKVDSLKSQNSQLKSRVVSLERRYDSLYLCNVELIKSNSINEKYEYSTYILSFILIYLLIYNYVRRTH